MAIQNTGVSLRDLQAQIAALAADNAALKEKLASKSNKTLGLKVSEKGGVALIGLRRFPIVLYKQEWEKVMALVPEIKAFIAKNEALLSTKD